MSITDDIPLLNWIPHFARRFLNKMRTGRGWKGSLAQLEEEALASFVKRKIQGVFLCHCDRTRTIVHLTWSGIVRGRSWARHISNDAWGSMIAETKLATEDQPRMLVKEPLEVECGKFYVLYANTEAHGHMGSCPGYALLIFHEKRQYQVRMNSESESEKLWREPWQEILSTFHSRILENTSMLQSSHSDQLTELDDFLQHVFLPAKLPALSCSSPISFFHAQIPARRHHQSTTNASDTSDPAPSVPFHHSSILASLAYTSLTHATDARARNVYP